MNLVGCLAYSCALKLGFLSPNSILHCPQFSIHQQPNFTLNPAQNYPSASSLELICDAAPRVIVMEETDIEDQFPNQDASNCDDAIIKPIWFNKLKNQFGLWIEKHPLIASMVAVSSSPLICLCLMPFLSLPHKMLIFITTSSSSEKNRIKRRMKTGLYSEAKIRRTWRIKIWSTLSRAGLLLISWLGFSLCIPSLKKLTLLGSPLWKWSFLAFTLTYAYLLSSFILMLLFSIFKRQRMLLTSEYFLYKLLDGVSIILYLGLALLSWRLYFCTWLEHVDEAFERVIWGTWVSLYVGSILWLWKAVFMFKNWQVKGILGRYEARIKLAWVKYHFLALVVDGFILDTHWVIESLFQHCSNSVNRGSGVTDRMVSRTVVLSTTCVTLRKLAYIASSRERDGIPDLLNWCQATITKNADDDECDLDDLRRLFPSEEGKKTVKLLYDIIQEDCSSDRILFADLKKWLVDAHKECVNMGRTLDKAKEKARRIESVMLCIIATVVVLLWLMLTETANLELLVQITGILLFILTTVVNVTGKYFFQDTLYTIHPFREGDLCIIDETEWDVKRISHFYTTFIKIASKEEIHYPNRQLATKTIINLGSLPNPSDVVVLILGSSATLADSESLKEKIYGFLSDPQQKGSYEKSHKVVIEEIGNVIKVTVHFTHVLSSKEVTHSQCFLEKEKRRKKFVSQIRSLCSKMTMYVCQA